ncbi:hypothetical protein QTP88_013095 [Uroleucon formosanum]
MGEDGSLKFPVVYKSNWKNQKKKGGQYNQLVTYCTVERHQLAQLLDSEWNDKCIVNVSAHQPAQPIVRPSVIQYAPPAIVPQDSIQIAPQIFVPVTPASGSNTSTDISLYDDDICMTVMNEYENEEG